MPAAVDVGLVLAVGATAAMLVWPFVAVGLGLCLAGWADPTAFHRRRPPT